MGTFVTAVVAYGEEEDDDEEYYESEHLPPLLEDEVRRFRDIRGGFSDTVWVINFSTLLYFYRDIELPWSVEDNVN